MMFSLSWPDKVMPSTWQMFGKKSVAVLACQAQFAMQRNWFPDPIQVINKLLCNLMITSSQGLFSYQTWNDMDRFWQNRVVLENIANCLHYHYCAVKLWPRDTSLVTITM